MTYVDPSGDGTPAFGGVIKSSWGDHVQGDIEYFYATYAPRLGGTTTPPASAPFFNVADYGSVGVGTDVTSATQAAVNALRAGSVPGSKLILAPGTISTSIDCTDITSETQGISLIVEGTGKGATRIVGNLSAALPVFDFSGSGRAVCRDFWVTGNAAGSQTAAFRFARASNGLGDVPVMERVGVDGTFSAASACFICDLWHTTACEFNSTAPVAYVWANTDTLSVGSAYTTLGSPSNTTAVIDSCTMSSTSRSGILAGGFGELRIVGASYCNLGGTASQAIELLSSTGINAVFADMRIESNGSTGNTSVLFIPAGKSCGGGKLTGSWNLHNSGTIVSFGDTTATLVNMEIRPINPAHSGSGSLAYFSANGGFYNNMLWNPTALPVGDASHNFPYSNIVVHGNNGTPWTFEAGGINLQITNTGVQLGNGAGVNAAMSNTGGGGISLTGSQRTTQGSGAPSTPGGFLPTAGDIYFRTDTPSTANQRIYICTTGGASPAWSGIV